MKKIIYLALVVFAEILFSDCKVKEKPKENAVTEEKKKEFLPVIEFLAGEIKHVDTVPYTLVKYTTINNHTDSVIINRPEFRNITNEFLEINIRDDKYKDQYEETSFADNTTRTASFTYVSRSPDLKLSKVDAYVNPESQKITRLYLERNYSSGDTAITKKLLWQTTGNFIIITLKNINNKESVVQEKIVWDEKEEQ
ncbi:MAG: hypothetical protein HYR66_12210 [Sphingobacteriales bacterium]|nr:hypothetical protein [Sphingobacteriales bacterium]MBI3720189.1 hypothetical protein [Sphingobacteriales bacterium]